LIEPRWQSGDSGLADESRPAPIGRSFGRYELLEDLGHGGMAVVSRARIAGPKGFTRTIVIKRILADLAEQPDFVEMLATEARLSALLRHRAIVQVYEFGQVGDEYYLAMEFVDGIDLLDLLKTCASRRLRLPAPVTVHIMAEIASALAYAHALRDDKGRPLGIVHRDVSPSNIMVTPLGEVKLLDFGIAKATSHVRGDETQIGTLKGKISYLSPEQAEGTPIDRRSDIFALGIVFHELLTMQRLFRGSSDYETMRLIRRADVRPPSHMAPGIPPELDAVVLAMLARDPRDRFASCDDVVEALTPIVRRLHADARALRDFLHRLGPIPRRRVSASVTSEPRVATGDPKATAPLRMTRPVTPRPRRQRWHTLFALGVALGAACSWIAYHAAAPKHPAPAKMATRAAARSDAARADAATMRRPAPPPAITVPKVTPPTTPEPSEAAAAAPVEPQKVRLNVFGWRGAELFVDDKLVGTLPVDLMLPSATGERRLTVRAPGMRPWTRVVAAEVDVSLKVALQRAPRVDRRRHATVQLIKDPFQATP
jgi:eukaryotic-like serine/threonine-protein kinase